MKCKERQTGLNDEQIIEMYWRRDDRAISETDKKYGQFLYNISYNILHDHLDCEECKNDTYLGVWNAIPPTNDTIQIGINMKREVVGINAKNLGTFSLPEKKIDKEAIANAISALENEFANYWTIAEETLILDSEGDYYISGMLYRRSSQEIDEDFETMMVYINVI